MGWWSATIMGGDEPLDWELRIEEAAGGLDKESLNKNLDKAIQVIEERRFCNKNIAYQALGVLIMKVGAEMDDGLRTKIMDNCFDAELEDWGDSEERTFYLNKYKDQIAKYDGTPQSVESQGLFEGLVSEE